MNRRLCLRSLLGVGCAVRAVAGAARKPGRPLTVQVPGGKQLLVQKQAGRVVLLDFMTTTCPTCKMTSAGIQNLFLELGPRGFLPVAVAIDGDSETVLSGYRAQFKLTFPLGFVAREEVGKYLAHPSDKLFRVPTLVLLDRRGRMVETRVGWPGEQEMRALIVSLLEEKQ